MATTSERNMQTILANSKIETMFEDMLRTFLSSSVWSCAGTEKTSVEANALLILFVLLCYKLWNPNVSSSFYNCEKSIKPPV